jgi:hypothetical protein
VAASVSVSVSVSVAILVDGDSVDSVVCVFQVKLWEPNIAIALSDSAITS